MAEGGDVNAQIFMARNVDIESTRTRLVNEITERMANEIDESIIGATGSFSFETSPDEMRRLDDGLRIVEPQLPDRVHAVLEMPDGTTHHGTLDLNTSTFTLHESERRNEDKTMTEPVTNIRLETGVLRKGRNLSARLWFAFVTRTGAEVPLKQHGSALEDVMFRPVGGFKGTTQRTIHEYRLLQPCRIKMINNCSSFGKLNQMINIYIDLHPDDAAIEIQGVEEFGLFQGRGAIDYRNSTFREHHRNYEMNEDIMKQFFGLRLLQPPRGITRGRRKVRSLLY